MCIAGYSTSLNNAASAFNMNDPAASMTASGRTSQSDEQFSSRESTIMTQSKKIDVENPTLSPSLILSYSLHIQSILPEDLFNQSRLRAVILVGKKDRVLKDSPNFGSIDILPFGNRTDSQQIAK